MNAKSPEAEPISEETGETVLEGPDVAPVEKMVEAPNPRGLRLYTLKKALGIGAESKILFPDAFNLPQQEFVFRHIINACRLPSVMVGYAKTMQPADPTAVKHAWDTTQLKIVLPTILLTSLVTALITEPLKVTIQNLWKRRQIRKHVLGEVAFNFRKVWLIRTVLAKDGPEAAKSFIEAEANRIQFTEYEIAQKDFYLFCRVPKYSLIILFYQALEWTKAEWLLYLKEPNLFTRESGHNLGLETIYGRGLELIKSSFTSRAIAWRYHLETVITQKPIRVVIRMFFAKHWKRLVVASWERYKADYKAIKQMSGDV